MTYLYEYTINDVNIKVEYTFSSVTDGIKVVDMWVDDKPHSINWMGPEAKAKLFFRLEADMEDRMCGTLDGDMPGFEGTTDALEDLVDSVVGEPEFLGGR